MKMYESSFYWNSDMSLERQREIIKWYNSLPYEQQKMVEDLRNDSYDQGRFDEQQCHEECG